MATGTDHPTEGRATLPEFKYAPPKYVQIADHVRARILSGEWGPGTEVPSERVLAAEWGVARPTATKALDELRREGLVIGRQGSGTYVAQPARFHRRANERYRRSSETGKIYPLNERAEIVVAELTSAPPTVVEMLRVEGTRAVRRQRLTFRDDLPVELSTSWFEESMSESAPRLLLRERILEGTVAYVEAMTGRRARLARDRISARLATPAECDVLGLDLPSAVLVTNHLVLDADDLPLEYAESVAPPEAWTVEHEYPTGT